MSEEADNGNVWKNRIVGHAEVVPSSLVPHPNNFRTHPTNQHAALRGSIKDIGFIRSVTVNKRTNRVVDGHLRLEEALLTNQATIPVEYVDLSEAEEKQALATIDPLAALAEADAGKLEALLRDVQTSDQDLADMLTQLATDAGIVPPEKPMADDPGPQMDRAAELQKKWGTAQGQLWEIPSKSVPGKVHRLLCGDSTKAEDVKRVMGGERAGLMNTDPPYGVAYANDDRPNPGVAKPRVANDVLEDEELQKFLEAVFRAATSKALLENAAWYMWHAHLTQGYFAAAAAAANVVLHRQIIWIKPVLLLGRGHYHWKHEPCFMGWVQGHQPPDYGLGNGERTQTTVWEVDSVSQADRKEFNHSTPKPIGLFTVPMVKHLKAGEIAYEPFAGSGPQFVAAEQTGRLCRGLELEPKYVAVILERLEQMGLSPRQI